MASQMPDARVLKTTVEITGVGPSGEPCVFTASGKAIEFAGFRRAYVEGSDDPEAELADQESILPALKQGDRVESRRGRGSARARVGGPRREGPRDAAASALHRGGAHQGTGAGGHRAAVHLRADDRHARAPRLHVQAGQGAGAELLGLRRHAPAARALRRLRRCRLHRRDGRGSRPDLQRRARLGVVHPRVLPRRRRRAPGARADGRPRGAEHRVPGHRHRRRSRPRREPLRVRVGRYGPFVQRGDGGAGNTATLPKTLPPADLTSRRRSRCSRQRPRGPRRSAKTRRRA